MINVSDIPEDKEILKFIADKGMFFDKQNNVGNFIFEEFDYPEYNQLLQSVKKTEEIVTVDSWKMNDRESESYKGFSLTYNPDYTGSNGVYHQTLGDGRITNNYSRSVGSDNFKSIKNSYWDTYGFRNRHGIIEEQFGNLFSSIEGAIIRSRVAYLYSENVNPDDKKAGWHIDELQHTMLRYIIPVKTTDNFILEMHGDDGFGNSASFTKTLTLGKAYCWNNRIPHRIQVVDKKPLEDPRINVIVGFSPWFNYDKEHDSFYPNQNYGKTVEEIVKGKLFLKD